MILDPQPRPEGAGLNSQPVRSERLEKVTLVIHPTVVSSFRNSGKRLLIGTPRSMRAAAGVNGISGGLAIAP